MGRTKFRIAFGRIEYKNFDSNFNRQVKVSDLRVLLWTLVFEWKRMSSAQANIASASRRTCVQSQDTMACKALRSSLPDPMLRRIVSNGVEGPWVPALAPNLLALGIN